MDLMLRQHDRYIRMYNCSFYSVNDIPLETRKHPVYGIFLITLFVVFEVIYAPCLFAMCQKKLRQNFCYKLMIIMGIYDMLLLPTNALFTGYFSLHGYMYCSMPIFSYMVGITLLSLWIGYAACAVTLAFNRCLLYTEYNRFFTGKLEYFWISLPFLITIYVFIFGRAGSYSSVSGALFFNPHVDYYPDLHNQYPTYIHILTNLSFSFLVPGVYASYFYGNYKLARNRTGTMSKAEYSLFFQLLGINGMIASSAFFCAIMQFITIPQSIMFYTHISWVLVSGAPPMIYLTFNRSIQKVIFKKMCNKSIGPDSTVNSLQNQSNKNSNITNSVVTGGQPIG